MRVKDKDRQRRLSRDEREARKKIVNKRKKCKHVNRIAVSQAHTKCLDCGTRIVEYARGVK